MTSKDTASRDFDAFVKRQQPTAAEAKPIDWSKHRDEWLQHLNELYEQIESFLAEYFKTGHIKREYPDITLTEEDIGSYKARQMVLNIGRQEITLTPIGTRLIGAKGRVDVAGPAGKTRFVLVNSKLSKPMIKVTVRVAGQPEPPAPEAKTEEIKWAWKITTSPPTIRYIELTRDSLFQALMEVTNG
ncbi:MAG: hypothetical protein ACYDC3_20100 [Candidatus Binataceae bacterium]